MKKIILTSFLFILSISAFPQWIAKFGIDYGTVNGNSYANHKVGFHLGAAYDFDFSKTFYFQPGLNFALHKFDIDEVLLVKEGNVYRYLLELPLNISFRPKINNNTHILIDAGPYIKYGLWGDKEYMMVDGSKSKASTYDAYNRIDIGINLGIGVVINPGLQVCLSNNH